MKKVLKKVIPLIVLVAIMAVVFTGCQTEAQKVNYNLTLEADNFNFAHDFYGIIDNIKRDTFPSTDFNEFIPRFAS